MAQTKTIAIKRVDDSVIDAMRLIVDWQDMREICMHRTTCIGCIYHGRMTCNRYNTEQIMRMSAEIFRDFLEH